MKCLAVVYVKEKHTPPKKKLENSKNFFFKVNDYIKQPSTKRFDSRKLTRKVAENMNRVNSQKYGYAPNAIEEKAVESERFREIYDFYRLVTVKQHAERYECENVEKDKK